MKKKMKRISQDMKEEIFKNSQDMKEYTRRLGESVHGKFQQNGLKKEDIGLFNLLYITPCMILFKSINNKLLLE